MADVPDRRDPPDVEVVAEAAALLRRLLDLVEDGTLTAPSGFVDRLHGALTALETVSGSGDAPSDDES